MATKIDVWTAALDELSPKDRAELDFAKDKPLDILVDLQTITEDAQKKSVGKQWRFKRRNGEVVIIRDLLTKIVKSLQIFVQIGDIVVQYDPVHAALPWAGVRFILLVAFKDVENFGFLTEGVEFIAQILALFKIFEETYSDPNGKCSATGQLAIALKKFYSKVLGYLAKAKRYFGQSTAVRTIRSSLTQVEFEKLLLELKNEKSQVEGMAKLIDAQRILQLGDQMQNLSLESKSREASLHNLLNELGRPIARMTSQLNQLEDRLNEDQRSDMLRRISTLPYPEHHLQTKQGVLSGTGKWLLESSAYTTWSQDSASSLLWLHGLLGSGKSKLVSVVIEDMKTANSAQLTPPPVYAYFSRTKAEPERSDPRAILSSLIKQLSCQPVTDQFLPPVLKLFPKHDRDFNFKQESTDSLCDCIVELVSHFSITTIVIDALDECEEPVTFLDAVESILDRSAGLVKIFISSRDEPDITYNLKSYPNVSITSDLNADDIEAFVRNETAQLIKRGRLLRSSTAKEEMKQLIIDEVVGGAQGMFRWASLQLEVLSSLKIDADIRARLRGLPPKLEELYDELYKKALAATEDTGEKIIQGMFRWLLVGMETMHTSDMLAALLSHPAIPNASVSKEAVLDLCYNFVVADDNLDVFRFADLSVREYLETHDYFYMEGLHTYVAQTCLYTMLASATDCAVITEYLSHFRNHDPSWMDRRGIYAGGFNDYANRHWGDHCFYAGRHHRSCSPGEGGDGGVLGDYLVYFLFTEDRGLAPIDIWLMSNETGSRINELGRELLEIRDAKAFFVSCAFGFTEMVEICLKTSEQLTIKMKEVGLAVAYNHGQFEVGRTIISSTQHIMIDDVVFETLRERSFDEVLWLLNVEPQVKLNISTHSLNLEFMDSRKRTKFLSLLLKHKTMKDKWVDLFFTTRFYRWVGLEEARMILECVPDLRVTSWMVEQCARWENIEMTKKLLAMNPAVGMDEILCKEAIENFDSDMVESPNTQRIISESLGPPRSKDSIEGISSWESLGSLQSQAVIHARHGCMRDVLPLLDRGVILDQEILESCATNGLFELSDIEELLIRFPAVDDAFLLGNIARIAKSCDYHFQRRGVVKAFLDRLSSDEQVVSSLQSIFRRMVHFPCDKDCQEYHPLVLLLSDSKREFGVNEDLITLAISIFHLDGHLRQILDHAWKSGLAISQAMLIAAATNLADGYNALKYLLELKPDALISEAVITASVSNRSQGIELVRLIEKYQQKTIFPDDDIMLDAVQGSFLTLELLLERNTLYVPTVDAAIASCRPINSFRQLNLLVQRNPKLLQSQELLAVVAATQQTNQFSNIFRRSQHFAGLVPTSLIIEGAVMASDTRTLQYILDLNPLVSITRSMMRNCAAFGSWDTFRALFKSGLELDSDIANSAADIPVFVFHSKWPDSIGSTMGSILMECGWRIPGITDQESTDIDFKITDYSRKGQADGFEYREFCEARYKAITQLIEQRGAR